MLDQTYLGNTIEVWLYSFGIITISAIVGKTLYWICGTYFKKWTKNKEIELGYIFVDMIEEPLSLAIVLTGVYFGVENLHISDFVDKWTSKIFYILTLCNCAWFVTRFLDILVETYVTPFIKKTEMLLDDHILFIVMKMVKFAVWSMAIIIGADNAGYDIKTVLTGLGIGGMAFALAAKDTISNLFGGITIFVDKPFKVKERIIINQKEGHVEEIGFRSTKIRTLEGRIVYIPNKSVADDVIVNISRESARRIKSYINLTYDTSPEQMEKAIQILKEVAGSHQHTRPEVQAAFETFSSSSLDILFIYYIYKPQETGTPIVEVRSEINLEILRRFNDEGIDFAFPTQTINISNIEKIRKELKEVS